MSSEPATTDEFERSRDRQQQRNIEERAHNQQLARALDMDQAEVEYLREIVKSGLDSGTIEVLDNYVSPDFILSNLREKDLSTFQWQLETKILQVFAMHPPQGGVGGKARAYHYDDPKDGLSPLRPQDRARIREYKDGILFRVRRSQGGFQQDKIGESTSRVETVNQNDDDGGRRSRIGGLLGR